MNNTCEWYIAPPHRMGRAGRRCGEPDAVEFDNRFLCPSHLAAYKKTLSKFSRERIELDEKMKRWKAATETVE